MKYWLIYFFSLFSLCCFASNVHSCNSIGLTEEQIAEKSVVNAGDLRVIKSLLKRAANGEDIAVGAIGGSITMGAAATKPEHRFANLTRQWLQQKFPEINVKLYNAGIGATDSKLGAFRLYKDLMVYDPDLVIVEYSINDSANNIAGKTFEGLIRQLLNSQNQPGIIILAMMNSAGKNVEEKHIPISVHYNIPMVSLRKVFEPLIESGEVKPETILADGVHPNDRGHETAALLITNILQKAIELPADENNLDGDKNAGFNTVSEPLHTDEFEFLGYFKSAEIKPTVKGGWVLRSHPQIAEQPWRLHGKPLFDEVWTAKKPGSRLEFKYKGTFAAITYWKENSDMGMVDIYIDGRKCQSVDAWGPQTWGGYAATEIIGKNVDFGIHTVSIVLSQDKNEKSNGHCFDLLSFGFGKKN
jgi:lysophospholipase L1-like esterase